MYQFVFLDLDDTLFDFKRSEYYAFHKLASDLNFQVTPAIYQHYEDYNAQLWQAIELGQLSKNELMATRFPNFFKQYQLEIEPGPSWDDRFRDYLAESTQLQDGALALLDQLSRAGCRLFAASNGIGNTQRYRLNQTRIETYFEDVFISETIGFNKPDSRFFEYIFPRIKDFQKDQAIMVGDKLSSDILAANNVQMAACWFNEHHLAKPDQFTVQYEADSLADIADYILEIKE